MTEQEYEAFKEFINKVLYEQMTEDDYYIVMRRLGVNHRGNRFQSCCHHSNPNDGGYNLAFNPNSKSFMCFSQCSCSYSLLSLVKKHKELVDGKCSTWSAMKFICDQINIPFNFKEEIKQVNTNIYKWQNSLLKYTKNYSNATNQIYDKSILNYLTPCYYEPWLKEGMTKESLDKFDIRWYDRLQQVLIPVYDDEGNLVGTHDRNTNPELVDNGFKYDHLRLLDGTEYKFQMGLVLYGLNMNKADIERTRTAILFEAPKSVIHIDGFYDYNISVAMFGMNLQKAKLKLLLKYGVNKFIIALDRQYKNVMINSEYTKEFLKYREKVDRIIDTIRPYAQEIGVVWDNDEDRFLEYKDSPVDQGKEVWEKLFDRREIVI